jgi:hypothetical protein
MNLPGEERRYHHSVNRRRKELGKKQLTPLAQTVDVVLYVSPINVDLINASFGSGQGPERDDPTGRSKLQPFGNVHSHPKRFIT